MKNPRIGKRPGWTTLAAAAALAVLCAGRAVAVQPSIQLTFDNGSSGCSSVAPVADASGDIVAWQSDCDPTGANADGSLEIFRLAPGDPVQQLTSGEDCTSGRPSISETGVRVAFESNCNLTGANPDGNFEIFLWRNGVLLQLTASIGCENLAPSINANGTQIAFDSTCNTAGTSNNGRGSEIFRVSATGLLTQLTFDQVGDCDSTSASISANGNLVAFDSDCDLVGTNEDRAIEIFTVNASGNVTQRTFAPDDSCSSVRPSMDGAGSVIAFQSDCDFLGGNADRSDEIFTVKNSGGQLVQVTSAGFNADCQSGEPRMASSGQALAFSGWCTLNGQNGDKSIEVFHAAVGGPEGGILAATSGAGCSSLAGALDSTGYRVLFDSDCNPSGANGDGSVEVFRVAACACGSPSSRTSPPKASDALFTLRAAVGSSTCVHCECDANSDGSIGAGDAQRILRAAVGQAGVTLQCPSL